MHTIQVATSDYASKLWCQGRQDLMVAYVACYEPFTCADRCRMLKFGFDPFRSTVDFCVDSIRVCLCHTEYVQLCDLKVGMAIDNDTSCYIVCKHHVVLTASEPSQQLLFVTCSQLYFCYNHL